MKYRLKQVLIIALCLMMLVSLIALGNPIKADEAEQEAVTIDMVFFGHSTAMEDIEAAINSPVGQKIQEETNTIVTARAVDGDQKAVFLAGGELTDLVSIKDQTDIGSMIEGGQIIPLNDLIAERGENISAIRPERLEMAQTLLSDGSGEAYVLPIYAGREDRAPKVSHSIYMTRWDYYKEMGYPEITGPDDMLNLLKEMQDKYPTNDDGEQVYGVGFYNSQNSTIDFDKRFHHSFGFHTINDFIMYKVEDDSMVYSYTDPDGPFWMAAEYYNKANRLGILDPDSLVQTSSDFNAKVLNGRMLSPWMRAIARPFEVAEREKDPETIKGFQTIPVEGTTLWTNTNQIAGWEAFYLAIPSNSQHPERVMDLINYTFSPEGARLISSGIEGTHWDYIDGVPQLTEEWLQHERDRDDDWEATGIGAEPFPYFLSGIAALEEHTDGFAIDLRATDEYYQAQNTPSDDDYSEHYGVSYPYRLFLDLIEEGKVFDRSTVDMRVVSGIGSASDDIQRIDSRLINIAIQAIPKAVNAESEEAFQQVKEETIAELESAGADESKEWWQNRFDEVQAFFEE